MATLTGMGQPGRGPAGREVAEPHTSRATDRPVGPDLLVWAAKVLPEVVGRGPVRCADVHTACYEAAVGHRLGRDRPHRLRLADEGVELFAGYLVASGRAVAAGRSTDTVWGWLVCPDQWTYPGLGEVQRVLAAAAGFWRLMLDAAIHTEARHTEARPSAPSR